MILIIRQKTDDKDLSKELKKRNISFFHQSVLEFNFNKRKIINQKNTFFIVASIQAVKSMKLYKHDYLDVIKKGKFLVFKLEIAEARPKIKILSFFFANIHIFIGKTDFLEKGGHEQLWWGYFFKRLFLRG